MNIGLVKLLIYNEENKNKDGNAAIQTTLAELTDTLTVIRVPAALWSNSSCSFLRVKVELCQSRDLAEKSSFLLKIWQCWRQAWCSGNPAEKKAALVRTE